MSESEGGQLKYDLLHLFIPYRWIGLLLFRSDIKVPVQQTVLTALHGHFVIIGVVVGRAAIALSIQVGAVHVVVVFFRPPVHFRLVLFGSDEFLSLDQTIC